MKAPGLPGFWGVIDAGMGSLDSVFKNNVQNQYHNKNVIFFGKPC